MTPSQSKIRAWREEEAETETETGLRVEEVERFVGLRNRARLVWETRKEEERVIEHAIAERR